MPNFALIMRLPSKELLQKLVTVVCSVALAVLIAALTMYDIMSVSLYTPRDKGSVFRISDFYNVVADSPDVRVLDPDIFVVSVDGYDRNGVAWVVETLDSFDVAAIGLDVQIPTESGDDSYVIESFDNARNLVTPVMLDQKGNTFEVTKTSFFDSYITPTAIGAVNLPGNDLRSVIREFRPYFVTSRGDSVMSLPTAVASVARPEALARLKQRAKTNETINFPARDYEVIPADSLFNYQDQLRGKMVLVGLVSDPRDYHNTPVEDNVPGVMIHAHALSTIIHEGYIDQTGDVVDWLVAIVLCAIVVCLKVFLAARKWGGLVIRVSQIILLYLIVVTGSWCFINNSLMLNFSRPLIMVTLGVAAVDIWNGLFYLGVKAVALLKRIYKRLIG